ncbi:MAG TPA: tetratricopeptide repeat protein, partial [Bacteroidia bacterium]|nr:tetratricopeptide repeat protein [Bacteroidia bacterium]
MRKTFFFCLVMLTYFLKAQQYMPPGTYTSTNKKAIKHVEEGKKFYEMHKDADAEKSFTKALSEDPNFVEAMMGLSYIYIDQNKHEQAIEQLKKATQVNPKFFPNNFYDLGELQYYTGKYDDAILSFQKFNSFERVSPEIKEKAQHLLACSQFAVEQIKNPKPFKPENMGPAINAANDEYFPTITADNEWFYFTRRIIGATTCDGSANGQEDFYVSKNINGQWSNAVPMRGVNSPCNEGSPSVS